MSDLETAVESFLDDADAVLAEYERGYVDADAALSVLASHVRELHEAADE